jgi:hypothetical protein
LKTTRSCSWRASTTGFKGTSTTCVPPCPPSRHLVAVFVPGDAFGGILIQPPRPLTRTFVPPYKAKVGFRAPHRPPIPAARLREVGVVVRRPTLTPNADEWERLSPLFV